MRTPLLRPLAFIYEVAQMLHRSIFLRSKISDRSSLKPLIVVGSLRAGGSGKTPITMELARLLSGRNYRVGILAYWMNKNGVKKRSEKKSGGLICLTKDLAEIEHDSDWRSCSDEAVLLARESGARIFVTRNREQAWDFLSRSGEFDILISDDGIMDPRLKNSFRIVLRQPAESPRRHDLLPAGPYHLTRDFLTRVNWTGEFERELVFPDDFDFSQRYWAFCGLGHPENFRRDLLDAGIQLAGFTVAKDHTLPNLKKVRAQAQNTDARALLCTPKDAVKLPASSEIFGEIIMIHERIHLPPGLISAVEQYLGIPSSS